MENKIKEKLEQIKYNHAYFDMAGGPTNRENIYIPLSMKLKDCLRRKYIYYHIKYGIDTLRFTIGKIPDKNLEVIAICYPKDNYSRKIGRNIVRSRIKQYLKNKVDIDKYPWIYILK